MGTYRKIATIEAHQWFKNGDHPLDYTKTIHEPFADREPVTPEHRKAENWEGDVVRYYRHPQIDGEALCSECGVRAHDHGWIDTREGGHRVCPGDWIAQGAEGEFWPIKPSVFAKTYVPA